MERSVYGSTSSRLASGVILCLRDLGGKTPLFRSSLEVPPRTFCTPAGHRTRRSDTRSPASAIISPDDFRASISSFFAQQILASGGGTILPRVSQVNDSMGACHIFALAISEIWPRYGVSSPGQHEHIRRPRSVCLYNGTEQDYVRATVTG